MVHTVDEALELANEAALHERPMAIALLGNAADVYNDLMNRGYTPDVVTDQTAAHDLLHGYIPSGVTLEQADFYE